MLSNRISLILCPSYQSPDEKVILYTVLSQMCPQPKTTPWLLPVYCPFHITPTYPLRDVEWSLKNNGSREIFGSLEISASQTRVLESQAHKQ